MENKKGIFLKVLLIAAIMFLIPAAVFADDGADAFKEKYEQDMYIESNNVQGTPSKLTGMSIALHGDLDDATKSIVSQNKDFFKISASDLQLAKQDEQGSMNYVFYTQTYEALPIWNSYLGFIISDDKLVKITSNTYAGVKADTEPVVSEKEAMETVEDKYNIEVFKDRPMLMIYPVQDGKKTDYKLVWKIETGIVNEPSGSWIVFVDADNGGVVDAFDKIRYSDITGTITGNIHEQYVNDTPKNVAFKNNYMYLQTGSGSEHYFYSNSGDDLDNSIVTADTIDLTGASSAELSFDMYYDTEDYFDYLYVYVSTDGSTWDEIDSFDGDGTEWDTYTYSLDDYTESEIYLAFEYVTDGSVVYDGAYIDEIKVTADDETVFYDNAENGTDQWSMTGFTNEEWLTWESYEGEPTDEDGVYALTNLSDGNYTLMSDMTGPYAAVRNYDVSGTSFTNNTTAPGTQDVNWSDYDTSTGDEESNVFYHVNKIHDFFTAGEPFDITAMDYATYAIVEVDDNLCNAYADGTDVYFGAGDGGNCTNLALSSDVIYHEYTHNVVDSVYTYYLPYDGQPGALNEAMADYFACTINNNSMQGEDVFTGDLAVYVRDLNNTLKYPSDWANEVHDDSRILSGALWEIRDALGADEANELVIKTLKMQPFSFTDFLEGMLIADDDDSDISDGTPNKETICNAFYTNHGIFSRYCFDYPRYVYTNDTSTFIPDNDSIVTQLTIDVPVDKEIQKLLVRVVYEGVDSWGISDLNLTVIGPDNTSAVLQYYGGDYGFFDLIYDIEKPTPDDLSVFYNKSTYGTWKLNITDAWEDMDGNVTNWSLIFFTTEGMVNEYEPLQIAPAAVNNSVNWSMLFVPNAEELWYNYTGLPILTDMSTIKIENSTKYVPFENGTDWVYWKMFRGVNYTMTFQTAGVTLYEEPWMQDMSVESTIDTQHVVRNETFVNLDSIAYENVTWIFTHLDGSLDFLELSVIDASSNITYDTYASANVLTSVITETYTDNVSAWRQFEIMNTTAFNFVNVTSYLNNFDVAVVNGTDYIIVNWTGTECNITPSSASTNCSGAPTYSAATCGADTFFVCKEDVNGNGKVDFYQWIQPYSNAEAKYTFGAELESNISENETCLVDTQCTTENCASDAIGDSISGTCTAAGTCIYNSTYVENTSTICNGDNVMFCSAGAWSSEACSAGCSDGKCNILVATITPTTPSGGSPGGSPVVTASKEVDITSDLDDGTATTKISRFEKIVFNYSGAKHSISIKELTGKIATLVIASTPKEYNFTIGEEMSLDLDGNGANDHTIILDNASFSFATITVKSMDMAAVQKPVAAKETPQAAEQKAEASPLTGAAITKIEGGKISWMWIAGLGVVSAVIIAFFAVRYYTRDSGKEAVKELVKESIKTRKKLQGFKLR